MKKISLFVTAVFLGTALFAQSPATFGLKGGLNVASIKWANEAETDARLGLHLGALAHIHLTHAVGLQPELVYSQEGGKMAVSNGSVTWKNDYINIPLMLQYMFNNGFRIEAGPQLGLLVASETKDDDGVERDADDVFKTTNVGLGFGLSYLSYSGLGVGARYNLGLNNITEPRFTDAKGRNLQISLFYMFDRAHKAKSR